MMAESKITVQIDGKEVAKTVNKTIREAMHYEGAVINKPWGNEKILINNEDYVIKMLNVNKGERLSLQYHEEKRETLIHVSGEGYVVKNGEIIHIVPNKMIQIEPYEIHQITASDESDLQVMEVSSPEVWDVVRIDDDHGRV